MIKQKFHLHTAKRKRPKYNKIGPCAKPTQIKEGTIIHRPVIAVGFILFGGILLTYPPCITAIVTPDCRKKGKRDFQKHFDR